MTETGQSRPSGQAEDFDDLAFAAMTTATVHLYRVLSAMRPKKQKKGPQRAMGDQADLLEFDQSKFVVVSISTQGLAFSIGEMHLGLGMYLPLTRCRFVNYLI